MGAMAGSDQFLFIVAVTTLLLTGGPLCWVAWSVRRRARACLSLHDQVCHDPCTKEAQQVWGASGGLLAQLKALPGCLGPDAALAEYQRIMREVRQQLNARLASSPHDLVRTEGAGHHVGAQGARR